MIVRAFCILNRNWLFNPSGFAVDRRCESFGSDFISCEDRIFELIEVLEFSGDTEDFIKPVDHFSIGVVSALEGDSKVFFESLLIDIVLGVLMQIEEHGLVADNSVERDSIQLFVADFVIPHDILSRFACLHIAYHHFDLDVYFVSAIAVG